METLYFPRAIPPITTKELIALQEFVTIPTYLIRELPPDKLYALLDIMSMADENGEVPISVRELMKRWGWSNTKVTGFIKTITEKDIGKTEKRQEKDTVFLVNTGFLEDEKDRKKTEKRQKTITKKDSKEQKNAEEQTAKKEQMYYPNDELLDSAFKEFLVMRNKIKKPIATKQALTRMMNKIDKLSGGDNDLAINILNQSTDHCWQDVYELKEDKKNSSYAKNGDRDILSEWRNS